MFILFFFFSSIILHTRCLSDWSSDVFSSDLSRCCDRDAPEILACALHARLARLNRQRVDCGHDRPKRSRRLGGQAEIGRASCRERVMTMVFVECSEKEAESEHRVGNNEYIHM